MDHRETYLMKKTMNRIYMVYGLRLLLHPRTLKSLLLLLLLWRSTTYVSYVNVLSNAPTLTDVPRNVEFFRASLMGTEMANFVIFMAVIVMLALLIRDMFARSASYF